MTYGWINQAGQYFETDHLAYITEWPAKIHGPQQFDELGQPVGEPELIDNPEPAGGWWPKPVPRRPSPFHAWDGQKWVEDTAAAVAAVKLEAVQAVNIEAGRRVAERIPTFKQLNMLARAVELTDKGKGSLNAAEAKERADILSAWAWIKTVRDESDRILAAVGSASTVAGVKSALGTAAWPQ